MKDDRKEYMKAYWQKNKVIRNIKTKAYRKATKLGKTIVKEPKIDATVKDVWNVRRQKKCFEYPKLYLNFIRQMSK